MSAQFEVMPPDASNQQQQQQQYPNTPRGSTAPLLPEGVDGEQEEKEGKSAAGGKRRFFGLGKKKEDKGLKEGGASSMLSSSSGSTSQQQQKDMPPPSQTSLKPQGQTQVSQPIPISPSRHPYPSMASAAAASPSRLRSGSPRLHSPASSEIFERSVQEPVAISTLQEEKTDSHMATHVITEDHIPPALEASAQAITSEELNPDDVEIVMSASHQPAASVLEASSSHADLTSLQSQSGMVPLSHVTSEASEPGTTSPMHHSGVLPAPPTTTNITGGSGPTDEEAASNYGQLDPNDVRRLSFISFADVVQSEHAAPPGSALSEVGNRDSLHIASLPSLADSSARAASPLRSPRSPMSAQGRSLSGGGGGVVTPPPAASSVGGEVVNPGSPVSPPSELTIETMRQALKHTASGELGGRSAGMSPVSEGDNVGSANRSRTNS